MFFVAVAVALVAIAVVVYFILANRPDTGVVEGRDRPVTSESAWTMEGMNEDLVLVEFQYEPQQAQISGSVMNNTTAPYVGVEAVFDVLDEQGTSLEQVGGFTSQLGPGETWQFSISVPPELAASRVEPVALRGGQRDVTGPQRDPTYPRSDTSVSGDENQRSPVVPRSEDSL